MMTITCRTCGERLTGANTDAAEAFKAEHDRLHGLDMP